MTTQGGDSAASLFATRLRGLLAGAGLQEVVTHSLLAPSPLEDPRDAEQRIAIRSALSAELSGLRRSLLPGLVDTMERNARRGQGPLWLFEIGDVFHRRADGYDESVSIAGALAGTPAAAWWRKDGAAAPADFYAARGIVERIAEVTGAMGVEIRAGDDPRLHSGRRADVLLCGAKIGMVGELASKLVGDLTVRDRIVVFEMSLDALREAESGGGAGSRLRRCTRACRETFAPRVARSMSYGRIRDAVQSAETAILERFDLTDVYAGAPLPEDVQSLTLALTFRAADRTLAESDVNDALDRIREALEKQCGATFAG